MERKRIVAGNWKMNLGLDEATELVKAVVSAGTDPSVEKIFFPPFPYLKLVKDLVIDEAGFTTGAQNCSSRLSGAFTGEVSAAMLREVGCSYVLIGHSERRAFFSETAAELKAKVERALEQDLKVIFCFGEKLDERKGERHFEIVRTQLEEVLSGIPSSKTPELVLAYEPVWAIGTGETASPAQAQEMHAFVRTVLAGIFNVKVATHTPVLYGGSCNAQNARELFACPDVDGGLIGGASLKAGDFCKIINSF